MVEKAAKLLFCQQAVRFRLRWGGSGFFIVQFGCVVAAPQRPLLMRASIRRVSIRVH
jgi:hypothetical protein